MQALAHLCHLTSKAAASLEQAVLASPEAAAGCLWRWQQHQEQLQLPAAMPWLALQGSLEAGRFSDVVQGQRGLAVSGMCPWLHVVTSATLHACCPDELCVVTCMGLHADAVINRVWADTLL